MPIYEDLAERISSARAQNLRPLVVLDVDDTLIDCRFRKNLVFNSFAIQPSVRERWPDASARVFAMPWENLVYRVQDNLDRLGITDSSFGEALLAYWLKHYFTYPYLIQDRAFPGASSFVHHCRELGAHIVYLTARDHAGMYKGTVEALVNLGFPMHAPDIHIMLKPEVSMNDHHFKVGALEQIAALGEVVASLENELINLNAMAERFTSAAMYWRKTLYAPDPPPPHPRVETLLHFP